MLIRPIRMTDLPRLLELARVASYGLTSLPPDEEVLTRRIRASQRSFAERAEAPGGETYLFVLEDADSLVQGISGIVSRVGGFEPFWAYRREHQVHASVKLGIRRDIEVLQLMAEHRGPTEIGSLFLAPEARARGGAGRLLSLSRFLFMADHGDLFESEVVAEMRGVSDERGVAPFWEAVGRHFFGMDFPDADYLSMRDKRFIAELMPRHPLYVPLLPAAAQAVIGEVHPNTRPALSLLQAEGFRRNGLVDIFEAGPVVACERERIGVIRRSRVLPLLGPLVPGDAGPPQMISNRHFDLRCALAPVQLEEQGLRLEAALIDRLAVTVGDELRIAALRAVGGGRDDVGYR